jgi:hypothetical protein
MPKEHKGAKQVALYCRRGNEKILALVLGYTCCCSMRKGLMKKPSMLSRFPGLTLTLAQARDITCLDLVAAAEVHRDQGKSYHEMEQESESKSHDSAREEAIGFVASLGYRMFPEGVGIRGIYTLADFVATKPNRSVFVEVLSDTNVTLETLKRKAQLQQYGEICFVLFSGTKRSNESSLLAAKRQIESWADVLYCRLNGYSGNFLDRTYKATVAYDTTRQSGIKVALAFKRLGRKLIISAKFMTHIYIPEITEEGIPPRAFSSFSESYEAVFLQVFKGMASKLKGTLSAGRDILALRAMHRKSGLKMVDADGQLIACLKSDTGALSLRTTSQRSTIVCDVSLSQTKFMASSCWKRLGKMSCRS